MYVTTDPEQVPVAQSSTLRNRKALTMTDTELKVIAKMKASDIPQRADAVRLMKCLGQRITKGDIFLFVTRRDGRAE